MKIAMACHPTHGGSGVVAAELGMRLAARGNEVHFVSYERPFRLDPLTRGIHFHEVEVSSYPLFRYPPYALALANEVIWRTQSTEIWVYFKTFGLPVAMFAFFMMQFHPASHRHTALRIIAPYFIYSAY